MTKVPDSADAAPDMTEFLLNIAATRYHAAPNNCDIVVVHNLRTLTKSQPGDFAKAVNVCEVPVILFLLTRQKIRDIFPGSREPDALADIPILRTDFGPIRVGSTKGGTFRHVFLKNEDVCRPCDWVSSLVGRRSGQGVQRQGVRDPAGMDHKCRSKVDRRGISTQLGPAMYALWA